MAHNSLMGNPGESDAKTVRMLQALKLRTSGMSFQDIAHELHISVSTAYSDVQAALAETRQAINLAALDFVSLELARLDKLQKAAWSKAVPEQGDPDITAAYFVLAVIDKRMKLLGLEPSQKLDITASAAPPDISELSDGQRQERIMQILQEARTRLLAAPAQITVIEQAPEPADQGVIEPKKTAKRNKRS